MGGWRESAIRTRYPADQIPSSRTDSPRVEVGIQGQNCRLVSFSAGIPESPDGAIVGSLQTRFAIRMDQGCAGSSRSLPRIVSDDSETGNTNAVLAVTA